MGTRRSPCRATVFAVLALLLVVGLAVVANLFASEASVLQSTSGGPVPYVPRACTKTGSCPPEDIAADRGEPAVGVDLRIDGRPQRFAGLTVNPDGGQWAVRVQLGARIEPPSPGPHRVFASDGVETFDGSATIDVVQEHQGKVLYITAR